MDKEFERVKAEIIERINTPEFIDGLKEMLKEIDETTASLRKSAEVDRKSLIEPMTI